MVVSKKKNIYIYIYVYPYLGKRSNLTNIWVAQPPSRDSLQPRLVKVLILGCGLSPLIYALADSFPHVWSLNIQADFSGIQTDAGKSKQIHPIILGSTEVFSDFVWNVIFGGPFLRWLQDVWSYLPTSWKVWRLLDLFPLVIFSFVFCCNNISSFWGILLKSFVTLVVFLTFRILQESTILF